MYLQHLMFPGISLYFWIIQCNSKNGVLNNHQFQPDFFLFSRQLVSDADINKELKLFASLLLSGNEIFPA